MSKKVFFAGAIAFVVVLASQTSVQAQLPAYCNYTRNPGYTETTWQQIQTICAALRGYRPQPTPQPTPQPAPRPTPQPQPSLQEQKVANYNAIMQWLRNTRPGRNGGYVFYVKYQIYQNGPWTFDSRPHYVRAADMQREVTRLINNGNLIYNPLPY